MILFDAWRHGPIRRRDPDGLLLEAGYRWDEARLFELIGYAALCLGAGTAALVMVAANAPPSGAAAAASALCALCALIYAMWCPHVVIFARDGRILTPNGVRQRFWVRQCSFPHQEIASVELTNDCKHWGVMLFTVEGRSVLLCERMHKADARLVAVQLTKALREMREALATVASRQTAAAESAGAVWVY